ncbi:unnamed protein product, partial [Nesidiocoris tenuis]
MTEIATLGEGGSVKRYHSSKYDNCNARDSNELENELSARTRKRIKEVKRRARPELVHIADNIDENIETGMASDSTTSCSSSSSSGDSDDTDSDSGQESLTPHKKRTVNLEINHIVVLWHLKLVPETMDIKTLNPQISSFSGTDNGKVFEIPAEQVLIAPKMFRFIFERTTQQFMSKSKVLDWRFRNKSRTCACPQNHNKCR